MQRWLQIKNELNFCIETSRSSINWFEFILNNILTQY